jgi:Leucine-rich repeat (LRR) protein
MVLDMTSNSISGNFPSFSSTTSLQQLYLGETQLGGSVPNTWTRLSLLENLNLQNLETTIGSYSILKGMTSLRHLDIGGAGSWGRLPESMSTLTMLEYLALNYAFNSGTIPTDLHSLTRLSK